jgi:hypothetical protein
MSIRSWWRERRQRADAEAVKRVQDEAVETPAERAHSRGDLLGEAADARGARRVGEAGVDDVNRLGDFPR